MSASAAPSSVLGVTWQLGADGDFAISNGRVALISGVDCLIQRLQNRLACDKGALLMHPDFGSGFGARVGNLMSDSDRTDFLNNLRHDILADPGVAEVISLSIRNFSHTTQVLLSIRTITDQVIENIIFPFPQEAP